jgi:hypothetical protein
MSYMYADTVLVDLEKIQEKSGSLFTVLYH